MLVSIDRLKADSTPVRRRLWEADDASLRTSIAALGVLEPLLVVRLGDDMDEAPSFEVKDGNRRLAAARALGLAGLEIHELPRRRDDFTLAAATAANMVRTPLDPVDRWRAFVQLQQRGYSFAEATACLGLPERAARQIDRLGRLHPDMLKLIEQHGLPPNDRILAVVSAAPQDVQQRAAADKRIMGRHWKTGAPEVSWDQVQQLCHRARFPRTAAIFDAETAGLAWEQDPFAQPGSPDEWTTADAPGFLKAQRAALEAQAAASKGRLVVVEESKSLPGDPALPKGWQKTYSNADKPKRIETVFACITARTGELVRVTAIDAAAEKARQKEADRKAKGKAKPQPAKTPSALGEEGRGKGTSAMPSAVGTVATPLGPSQPDADDDIEDDIDDDTPEPAAPTPKPPMTHAGFALLAGYKTEALRKRLRDRTQPISNDMLVPLLILALHAANVRIEGYERGEGSGACQTDRWNGQDLVRRLVNPAGQLQFDGAELPQIAGEALARTLSFDRNRNAGSTYGGSGVTAEWIGAAIDAEAHLPRLDTAEFLATLAADKLKNAAVVAGEKFTTAAAAKRDLPGKLPGGWVPDYAQFGAPGPRPAKGG